MHDKIKIDLATGLYIEPVSPDTVGDDIIEMPCPDGFYKPKWNGTAWVEGLTAEEIAAIKANVPEPQPTIEELATGLNDAMVSLMQLSLE